MTYDQSELLNRCSKAGEVRMKDRQQSIYERYASEPDAATITDFACTDSSNVPANMPLYGELQIGSWDKITMPVGVHAAVGGESDYPIPGDILCGAIAACLDSTIRIIASRVRVKLKTLSVEVKGTVDVRGTLLIEKTVPVRFQKFDIRVQMQAGLVVPGMVLEKILRAAERSCVVVQSLSKDIEIEIQRV